MKRKEMIINSKELKLLHDYYQSTYCFTKSFKVLVSNLAVVFLKFSDVKPINQPIVDIS